MDNPPEPPPLEDPPPPPTMEPPPPPPEEEQSNLEEQLQPSPSAEFNFSTFESQYNDEYYDQPPSVQTLFQSQNYTDPDEPPPPSEEPPETPEQYANYVKQTIEEQGYDFNEWAQEMKGNPDFWWLEEQQPTQSPSPKTSTTSSLMETTSQIDYTFPAAPPPKKLMGIKSFHYLETRVLANFLKDSEDERMDKIKARLGFMKKVKPPKNPSVSVLFTDKNYPRISSRQELGVEPHHATYTPHDWALKHAISFLQKSGCRSPDVSFTDLKLQEKPVELKVFLNQVGKKRRGGIGSAFEIDIPFIRRAERAVLRFLLNTSKPRYPLPRFILPKFLNGKRTDRELIGPGTYDHEYYENQRLKRLKSMPSLWKSCSLRFPREKVAHPASAFIANPYSTWDRACERKRHPGKVPLFQSTPCNFRHKTAQPGSGLPPGHYDIRSPLESYINEKKSLRGMYAEASGLDKFCPKSCKESTRSKTIEHHLKKLGPGSYNINEGIVTRLNDTYNSFKGKLSKTERSKMCGFRAAYEKPLWPEDKGFPGPTSYDPYENGEWIESDWVGFGVQDGRKAKSDGNKLMSPDFYFYQEEGFVESRFVVGNGMRSNFLSKSPMTAPQSMHVVIKERNKATHKKFDQQQEPIVVKQDDIC